MNACTVVLLLLLLLDCSCNGCRLSDAPLSRSDATRSDHCVPPGGASVGNGWSAEGDLQMCTPTEGSRVELESLYVSARLRQREVHVGP